MREGSAIYKFADGSEEVSCLFILVCNVDKRSETLDCKWMIQVSLYKGGEQTGPAKFTWPNGAVREGSKVSTLLYYNSLGVEL